MESKKTIILFGPPGCGKGTQGKLLVKELGYTLYGTSTLIKKELTPGTPLYEKVINQGILLGDDDVFEIIEKYVDTSKNIIIDGMPRTIHQAEWLKSFLEKNNYSLQFILLDVNVEELILRVTSRWFCPKCRTQYNYHVPELTPKIKEICDKDGEKLVQRKDDSLEIFKERLHTQYLDHKEDIVKVFEDVFHEIDANDSIKNVFEKIKKKLD